MSSDDDDYDDDMLALADAIVLEHERKKQELSQVPSTVHTPVQLSATLAQPVAAPQLWSTTGRGSLVSDTISAPSNLGQQLGGVWQHQVNMSGFRGAAPNRGWMTGEQVQQPWPLPATVPREGDLPSQLQRLCEECKRLEAQVGQQSTANNQLRSRLEVLEKDRAELQKRLQQGGHYQQQAAHVVELQRQLKMWEQKYLFTEEELREVRQQSRARDQRLTQTETQLRELEAEVSRQKEIYQEAEMELRAERFKLMNAKRKRTSMEPAEGYQQQERTARSALGPDGHPEDNSDPLDTPLDECTGSGQKGIKDPLPAASGFPLTNGQPLMNGNVGATKLQIQVPGKGIITESGPRSDGAVPDPQPKSAATRKAKESPTASTGPGDGAGNGYPQCADEQLTLIPALVGLSVTGPSLWQKLWGSCGESLRTLMDEDAPVAFGLPATASGLVVLLERVRQDLPALAFGTRTLAIVLGALIQIFQMFGAQWSALAAPGDDTDTAWKPLVPGRSVVFLADNAGGPRHITPVEYLGHCLNVFENLVRHGEGAREFLMGTSSGIQKVDEDLGSSADGVNRVNGSDEIVARVGGMGLTTSVDPGGGVTRVKSIRRWRRVWLTSRPGDLSQELLEKNPGGPPSGLPAEEVLSAVLQLVDLSSEKLNVMVAGSQVVLAVAEKLPLSSLSQALDIPNMWRLLSRLLQRRHPNLQDTGLRLTYLLLSSPTFVKSLQRALDRRMPTASLASLVDPVEGHEEPHSIKPGRDTLGGTMADNMGVDLVVGVLDCLSCTLDSDGPTEQNQPVSGASEMKVPGAQDGSRYSVVHLALAVLALLVTWGHSEVLLHMFREEVVGEEGLGERLMAVADAAASLEGGDPLLPVPVSPLGAGGQPVITTGKGARKRTCISAQELLERCCVAQEALVLLKALLTHGEALRKAVIDDLTKTPATLRLVLVATWKLSQWEVGMTRPGWEGEVRLAPWTQVLGPGVRRGEGLSACGAVADLSEVARLAHSIRQRVLC